MSVSVSRRPTPDLRPKFSIFAPIRSCGQGYQTDANKESVLFGLG